MTDSVRRVVLLCVAGWSLCVPACAPVASLRPPSGLEEGRSYEVGAGAASLGSRPYVQESAQLTGQLWFTTEAARWLSLSAIAAFDQRSAAGGAAARWNALRTSRVAFGPEAELGFAWAAGSLGFGLRTFGQNWLYTAPRIGTLGSTWTVGVPAGVSIELPYHLALRAEAQLSWAELRYYNRRLHLAAGLAYQF